MFRPAALLLCAAATLAAQDDLTRLQLRVGPRTQA